jgi:hypothetical protein
MNTDWLEVAAIVSFGAVMLLWAHRWNRNPRAWDLVLRRRRAALECEVIPRRDATTQELKALASALDRWISESAQPFLTTAYAVADLHGGELPQPLSVAFESYLDDQLVRRGRDPPSGQERSRRHQEIVQRLGPIAASRTVLVHVRDAKQAIASLRKTVPPELVEDILIDRRSWNDSI